MPSALRASRDFLARVRSGASAYGRNLDREGAEIKVEPFDSGNVSTPAALIKLGTSIAAARRHKANLQAAQQDVELAREKTRAEIAHLRAEAEYNLGTGRQNATAKGPAVLTHKVGRYDVGTPITDVSAGMAQDRLDQSKARSAAAAKGRSHLAQANAGIKQIDAAIERDVQARVAAKIAAYEPHFRNAQRVAVTEQDKAIQNSSLRLLGINPQDFTSPYASGGPDAGQKMRMLAEARERISDRLAEGNRIAVRGAYQAKRDRYQQVIDQGIPETDEGDQGGDPNDPLGLPPDPLDPGP